MEPEPREDEDDEDLDEEEDQGDDETEGSGGAGSISEHIAQMPGYEKLSEDQRAVLSQLSVDEGFEDRDQYLDWVHRILVLGLGRRPKFRRLLTSALLVPFMVQTERGTRPAGKVLRFHLRAYVLEELFPPANMQFSRKAKEQPYIRKVYLETASDGGPEIWDRVARTPKPRG